MMRRVIVSACMGGLLAILGACQEDSSSHEGFGYLQLSSVGLDKNVIPHQRAAAEEMMGLNIWQNGVVVKHVDDWKQIQNQSLLLPVGVYQVQAYSAQKDSTLQGFNAQPYYLGENKVTIVKNEAQTVDVKCPIVQSMVSVSYSENFKKAFTSYEGKISNTFGSVDFASTETRAAYFRTGQPLHAVLNVTNKDGKSFTFQKEIIAKAERRFHYKVNYDVTNSGNGDFHFTVDPTTHEYEVNITVPTTTEADPALKVTGVNAFGQFAYLTGTVDLANNNEPVLFQYKKTTGAADWVSVTATKEGTSYTAKTEKLDFATSYICRLACGAKVGVTETFTTETFEAIPNLNFDTWTQSGKNWFANADAADSYWATGNTGVTSFLAGSKNPVTVPVDGIEARTGKAAKLTTITGVTLVGAAAGNLFIGSYKTDMSKPANSVKFGRPYAGARPVALSGYYKYESKAINHGTKPGTLQNDECNIYVRLWDASGAEIGFGEFVGKQSVAEYTKFTFEIKYTNPTAKPAKIAIVATSSHYGGDFEGSKVVGQVGAGSTLWIDDFELSYYK